MDDIWDKDFGDIVVDRTKVKDFSGKYRGSIRMGLGLFFSNGEYENWRKEELKKPLP